jgi:hypothetical protein
MRNRQLTAAYFPQRRVAVVRGDRITITLQQWSLRSTDRQLQSLNKRLQNLGIVKRSAWQWDGRCYRATFERGNETRAYRKAA